MSDPARPRKGRELKVRHRHGTMILLPRDDQETEGRHLHGNTYCYEGDECVICREQKQHATSDGPEAATRSDSDSFQPSAPNGGDSGQYLTPAQAVAILVRDEMKHAENYVRPEAGVVRFCITLAHLNILLKAVEGE